MSQDSGLRGQIAEALYRATYDHERDDASHISETDAMLAFVQARLNEQAASFDQRLSDVQDEYAKAGASWDASRKRLAAEIEKWRKGDTLWHNEARKMAEAGDRERERADRAGEQMRRERQHKLIAVKRAEQAEAKHRDMLKALRDAEAENARLREALQQMTGRYNAANAMAMVGERHLAKLHQRNATIKRVSQMADAWEERLPDVIRTAVAVEAIRSAVEPAALDQAPAEEANET